MKSGKHYHYKSEEYFHLTKCSVPLGFLEARSCTGESEDGARYGMKNTTKPCQTWVLLGSDEQAFQSHLLIPDGWRSLNIKKGALKHPTKVTKNGKLICSQNHLLNSSDVRHIRLPSNATGNPSEANFYIPQDVILAIKNSNCETRPTSDMKTWIPGWLRIDLADYNTYMTGVVEHPIHPKVLAKCCEEALLYTFTCWKRRLLYFTQPLLFVWDFMATTVRLLQATLPTISNTWSLQGSCTSSLCQLDKVLDTSVMPAPNTQPKAWRNRILKVRSPKMQSFLHAANPSPIAKKTMAFFGTSWSRTANLCPKTISVFFPKKDL